MTDDATNRYERASEERLFGRMHRIADDLRRIADEVDQIADREGSRLNPLGAIENIIHTITWGIANASVDGLLSGAWDLREAQDYNRDHPVESVAP